MNSTIIEHSVTFTVRRRCIIILRKRLYYFCYILVVIVLGLLSREFSGVFPKWIGDILWGLMVFLIMGFVFRDRSIFQVAMVAFAFSIGIETAKLYHEPWIDSFRYTRIGGLLLGYVFSWGNIVCYITGILLGVFGERFWCKIYSLLSKR